MHDIFEIVEFDDKTFSTGILLYQRSVSPQVRGKTPPISEIFFIFIRQVILLVTAYSVVLTVRYI